MKAYAVYKGVYNKNLNFVYRLATTFKFATYEQARSWVRKQSRKTVWYDIVGAPHRNPAILDTNYKIKAV